MIIRLQNQIEFPHVAKVLVQNHMKKYDKTGGITGAICKADGLKQEHKDTLLIEIIKEAIK